MPVKEKRILSMLGLAAKSGNLVSGEFSTEKAVKERKARLVIVAVDASEATKKNFRNLCGYYKVPVFFCADKEVLGHSIGKLFRASAAVTDEGLARAILGLTGQDN